jgi:hypothetical protein
MVNPASIWATRKGEDPSSIAELPKQSRALTIAGETGSGTRLLISEVAFAMQSECTARGIDLSISIAKNPTDLARRIHAAKPIDNINHLIIFRPPKEQTEAYWLNAFQVYSESISAGANHPGVMRSSTGVADYPHIFVIFPLNLVRTTNAFTNPNEPFSSFKFQGQAKTQGHDGSFVEVFMNYALSSWIGREGKDEGLRTIFPALIDLTRFSRENVTGPLRLLIGANAELSPEAEEWFFRDATLGGVSAEVVGITKMVNDIIREYESMQGREPPALVSAIDNSFAGARILSDTPERLGILRKAAVNARRNVARGLFDERMHDAAQRANTALGPDGARNLDFLVSQAAARFLRTTPRLMEKDQRKPWQR